MPLFSDLVKRAGSGLNAAIKAGQQQAKDWFRRTAQNVAGVNVNEVLRSNPDRFLKTTFVGKNTIGRMVMFFYDAKTKKELPYYDKFPLIFPIETYRDGFLGINLHYLPYYARAQLMDALYRELSMAKTDEQRFKISYKLLKNVSRFSLVKPCIKRYLYKGPNGSGIKSRFFIVNPDEWDAVLCLPVERFVHGGKGGMPIDTTISKRDVWRDSMRGSSRRRRR